MTLAWAVCRRLLGWADGLDIVFSTSALFGGCDVAAVHFLSANYYLRLRSQKWSEIPAILRVRQAYLLFMHGLWGLWEGAVYRRAARRKSPLLVPVTRVLADSLRERFGPALEQQVIANPVSLERFHSGAEPETIAELAGACPWVETHLTLLFVGADFLRKGLADVIRAVAAVPDTGCLVVGAGNAEPFRALARSLGVEERIAFHQGAGPDMPRLYKVRRRVRPAIALRGLAHRVSGGNGERAPVNPCALSGLPERVDCRDERIYRERLGGIGSAPRESPARSLTHRKPGGGVAPVRRAVQRAGDRPHSTDYPQSQIPESRVVVPRGSRLLRS